MGRSIGPSFYDIAQRYPENRPNLTLLARRIRAGSTGVWGKTPMPTHMELTSEQSESIASWILEKGLDPDLNYLAGTKGTFMTRDVNGANKNGLYLLTASYLDHGQKPDSANRLKGVDQVLIYQK
jgi:cytochrome c